MKTMKNLLVAAAVTGALAAFPLTSYAGSPGPDSRPSADKQGCNGKGDHGKKADKSKGGDKDKAACASKDKAACASKDKEKTACAGKDGCGGKDKPKS